MKVLLTITLTAFLSLITACGSSPKKAEIDPAMEYQQNTNAIIYKLTDDNASLSRRNETLMHKIKELERSNALLLVKTYGWCEND